MEDKPLRLLVVDDDASVVDVVRRFASAKGFNVVHCDNGNSAITRLADLQPDAALIDLQMPGVDGINVIRSIRAEDPRCHAILMTGNATLESAIEAMKAGALDYLTKPFDQERLNGLLVTVRENIRRRERILEMDADFAQHFEFCGMIGRSPAMQELFDTIRRLGPHVRTALIEGETGTGKELVAKALHQLGPRQKRRFVTVNCSAVVDTLFESELFGHVRGAFTGATEAKVGLFEHADGGTLFLDEAGELPLKLQAKLLRAVEYGEVQRVGSLESRKVDVHVVAATNRDLKAEVAAGRFRPDLFYRLSIIEIRLTPLRHRPDDVCYLTARFVRECAERLNLTITGIAPSAERALQSEAWPGNVRELKNVIERACILTDNKILTERDILHALDSTHAGRLNLPLPPEPGVDSNMFSTAQRVHIERVLRQAGGNKSAAAKLLGMSRRSLYRWLDRLKLGENGES